MTNNNVQNVKFLRNGVVFGPSNGKTARQVALDEMNGQLNSLADGTAILGRYKETDGEVKTLVGFAYISGNTKTLTVFDVDGASADVDKKIKTAIEALNAEITSSENTNVQVKVTEVGGKITAVNITTDNTVNSNDVASAIETEIGKLEYSDTAVDGEYVSQVSETDGKIAVKRVALPSLKEVKETGKPIVAVSENKGQVAASAGNINAEFVDIADNGGKFTATTVEGALAEIATEIDAMDLSVVSGDGEVITAVSEEDGKVSASKTAIKDVKLTGYVKNTTATGAISGNDDIEDALSKLENTIGSNAITNDDGSITVTTGSTTDVKVNIKSGEKVIKKDGNGGLYTNIAISAATSAELATLGTNVQEAYKLVATDGTKLGEFIKIYKDSSLVNLYLGHVDDLLSGTAAQTEESESSVVVPGSGSEALVWIVQLADGKYKLAAVDVESFLQESEFKDGLQVSNHEVSVKVDSTSEAVTTGESATANVLSVSSEGVKVGNIQSAIDYAISKLDANVTGGTTAGAKTNGHVQVVIDEVDGKLTTVTVNEANIADANKLAGLSGKTVTEAASSNDSITVTPSEAADGTKHLDIITDASKIKMSGFTNANALTDITESSSVKDALLEVDKVITEKAEVISTALNGLEATKAEKTALDAEIAARKDVDGQNGDKYAANANVNYIGDATSLNDADVKLDAALKTLDDDAIKSVKVNGVKLAGTSNAVNVQISSVKASGTDSSPIVVNTDNTGAVTLQILQIDCGEY